MCVGRHKKSKGGNGKVKESRQTGCHTFYCLLMPCFLGELFNFLSNCVHVGKNLRNLCIIVGEIFMVPAFWSKHFIFRCLFFAFFRSVLGKDVPGTAFRKVESLTEFTGCSLTQSLRLCRHNVSTKNKLSFNHKFSIQAKPFCATHTHTLR